MKKFTLFLILFAFCKLSTSGQEFFENLDYKRLSFDLLGSLVNGNTLLVYGEAGTILRSKDFGNNWEKINIPDSLTILKIVSNNNEYFGLTNKRWGIISTDDGRAWTLIDLGDYNFHQLLPYTNGFVVLADTKILLFNKSYQKVNEFTYGFNLNYINGTISGNKLYYSTDKGKLGILDLEKGKQSFVSLVDLGICYICDVPTNLMSDTKGTIYFTLGSYFFRYNTLQNVADTLAFRNRNNKVSAETIFRDSLFYIFSRFDPLNNKDSARFVKVTKNEYVIISKSPLERYIPEFKFNNLNFKNRDTIIAVGSSNLVYVSFDGGLSWQVKSYIGNYFYIDYLNELNLRAIGPYGSFYYSNDGGTKWLPTRDALTTFQDQEFSNPMNYGGSGMFKDAQNGGVFFVLGAWAKSKNCIFTNDGGEHLSAKKMDVNQTYSSLFHLLENKGNYLFIQSGCNPYVGCWSVISYYDDTFKLVKSFGLKSVLLFYASKYQDKIYALGRDSADPDFVYSVFYSSNEGEEWIKDFSFSTDSVDLLSSNLKTFIEDFFVVGGNKLMIQGTDTFNLQHFYKIDINNRIARKILATRGDLSPSFAKINNTYYLFTTHVKLDSNMQPVLNNVSFFSIDLSSSNISWDTLHLRRYSNLYINNIKNDSILIFNAYDSLVGHSVAFLGKVRKPLGIEKEIEIEKALPIYISFPEPQPATDRITMKIYWDQGYNIDECKIAAYNFLGVQVANNTNFTLSKNTNYNGIVIWDVSNLPTGVYFVKISLGTYSSTAVVIKN